MSNPNSAHQPLPLELKQCVRLWRYVARMHLYAGKQQKTWRYGEESTCRRARESRGHADLFMG